MSSTHPMFADAEKTGAVVPAHVGIPLYAQCACLDAARPAPIKVAVSRGTQAALPGLPRLASARLYDAGRATATTGTLDPSGTPLGTAIRLD